MEALPYTLSNLCDRTYRVVQTVAFQAVVEQTFFDWADHQEKEI
jgi:hypothetical protein